MTIHERPFGRYLDDFEVGDIYRHWPGKTITEYDDHLFCMITLNHHPLHTNAWYAENETVQGRNVVVGNLVYSVVLGLSVPDVSGSAIANLEVDALSHKLPTFHGDTIYAETRVLGKRPSSSKPDRGVVEVESKGINQRGEEVCSFRRRFLVWTAAAAPGPPPTVRRRHLGMSFALDLGAWGGRVRRDLPWRATRDPWAVLVSEAMLQQTQVARVVGPWRAFLERFPDPDACAGARPGEVIALWAGLGYNRRAVHLHAAAVRIRAVHGGRVPDRLEDLLALPGVGAYTARAVLAFAFEADVGVVDTNAARVLARALAGRSLGPQEVQRLADSIVPPGGGWAHNQAMLDLGATVCTKGRPACPTCPVAPTCSWALACHRGPDPAVGSAGTSGRQSTFAGSDRQGRGRIVAALRAGMVRDEDVARLAGWPTDAARAERVLATLVADGLVERRPDGGLVLAGM